MSKVASNDVVRVPVERTLYAIGIDAGTKTGLGIWDVKGKRFEAIVTTQIHRAQAIVKRYHEEHGNILVRVEDARQVRFGTDRKRAQGAGSVKRDAKMWEDYLKDNGIPFEMVRPNKVLTKWDAKRFATVTRYEGQTSEHGRDGAMLVYDF